VTKVLISVLGQDQSGIIAMVSRAIAERRGNIESISQTLLQDVFGALVIAAVPEGESPASLEEALRQACADQHLFVHVNSYAPSAVVQKPETQPYVVTATGPDNVGLIAAISATLSRHGLNITNLYARFTGGSGRFDNVMIFETDVPRATVMDDLRADLAKLGGELHLDINIQHRKIFEAVSHIDR
jgi:glycine cleavage system transcriptional repressor